MYGLRHELLPPSGVEHAVFIKLTPSSLGEGPGASSSSGGKVIANLVVARSSLLRIFEVREEPAPLPTLQEAEAKTKSGASKPGTEAVEGEVEMDREGEGFVSMAQVKSLPAGSSVIPSTVTRLFLLREHRLHGNVTGLASVKTIASSDDGLDRLLISFRDAKISLLEWSEHLFDITTVSIHTYERAPKVLTADPGHWRGVLRVDPSSRCAALSLPKESLAILPFHTAAELEMMDQERQAGRDIPYSPSFILDLGDVDVRIKNIIDFAFIPGFNNPTIAVAFQTIQTWTGRLNEHKDTVSVFIITIDAVTRTYPVISQMNDLPYDVLYLVPCPAALGGVLLVTPNAILHVDQTSRTVGVAVNGWANRVSAINLPIQTDGDEGHPLEIKLEGSSLAFLRDDSIAIFLVDGSVRRLLVHMEGRNISRLEVSPVIAQCTIASVVSVFNSERVFIGSTAGPSVLLRALHSEEVVEKAKVDTVATVEEEMELDEEIYGDLATQAVATNIAGPDIETVTVTKLTLRDALPDHGIISHMTFGVTMQGDRPLPELVACTGVGHMAGLTRFTNYLPTRLRRKIPGIGGAQGIWSMHVKRSTSSQMDKRNAEERHSVIVTTNASPAPMSRIITRKPNGDVNVVGRTPGVTIAAGPFFQNTCFVQVMTDSVRLIEAEGRERRSIKDGPGQSKIASAAISDPFILLRREDGAVSLLKGDTMEGKLIPVESDMLPACTCSSIFTDASGVMRSAIPVGMTDEGTETLEDILDADRGKSWVYLLLKGGELQIRSLPALEVVFSSRTLGGLPPIVVHELHTVPEVGHAQGDIEQICIAPIGEGLSLKYYLTLLTKQRVFVAYEILPAPISSTPPSPLRLVKVLTRILQQGHPQAAQELKSFELAAGDSVIHGVFCTGEEPFWVLARNCSPLRLYPAMNSAIHAFAPSSMFANKGDVLVHSEEGPALIQWIEDLQIGLDLPFRNILLGRQCTSVVFDRATLHFLAITNRTAKFTIYDEEGNRLWAPDGPGISDPTIECSSLELLSPDTWTPIDGYEFARNEFVNVAESVSLETLSAEQGVKDFIVVGTTIFRGEDLAVKGATYVFEVVEVVKEPGSLKRRNKLKLLCRDEAKGPITAVCGMNGYLVSSMGQKASAVIYVRAFELDERLIGLAFLDVGLSVTSLTTVKNLLLVSDAAKSVWFVCFQEDPFKLVILGKDPATIGATNANFFFGEGGDLSFVTSDDRGILRIYDYNPMDPDSNAGQRLLCRTEFDAQEEHKTALTVARRPTVTEAEAEEEIEVQLSQSQSVLVFDGAISILSPVDTPTFKRLSLLQGHLVRNVQHVGGLNPKSFRTVRNDTVSRSLTKGILDGNLLAAFGDLPVARQIEAAKTIGTGREVVLDDFRMLWKSW
ncbi:mRNA cleavage and polyadenylation factor subunit [Tulasnella sp. 424]|nr:mRNA cleavage and polyadenylation factor subunit [Tulasnella sp. 424]